MVKKHTKTLAILHNIFLTKEQREILEKGDSTEVIGVSIPVWFYKGNTSEPAIEVFCKYLLTNIKDDYPVTQMKDGYKINMPQTIDGEATEKFSLEESYIHFRRYNKITDKGERTNIVHTVEINTMESLENSLSL